MIQNGAEIKYEWKEESILDTKLPNNGRASVDIPSNLVTCRYPTRLDLQLKICPVVFKVSFSSADPEVRFKLPQGLGQWSGIGFMKANVTDGDLRQNCEKWSQFDGESSRLTNLIPCPPTLRLARFDPQFQEVQLTSVAASGSNCYPQNSMQLFHPDSHVCYNEAL